MKKKAFVIFSAAALAVFLFLLAQMIRPCHRYEYEGGCLFGTDEAARETVVYDGICLRPGVYRVRLAYETDTDLAAACTVADGTVFLVLATRYFPWDMVQRLGNWALKLVALIRSPTVFAGMAWACLCIPAAGAMESVDDVEGRMRSGAIRLLALAACLGICVFQCSRILH